AAGCLVLVLLFFGAAPAQGAGTNTVQSAKLKVSGFGLLGNRELKKTIRLMSSQKTPPEFYDANFVEDAALIILCTVTREGYLAPRITATLTLAEGQARSFEWDTDLNTVLPRPLSVKKVRFRVRRGVRYYYRSLEIDGVKSLSRTQARSYFLETGF